MNYSHLRAFHAVASQGSFTKAAKVLHVTQPTISDQVKALEQRYSVVLFGRRGRHITLTPIGQALLEVTQRQFSLEAEAEELLTAARGLAQGLLRVSADAPYHVVPLLGRFHRLHPGIRLTLDFGNSTKVLRPKNRLIYFCMNYQKKNRWHFCMFPNSLHFHISRCFGNSRCT